MRVKVGDRVRYNGFNQEEFGFVTSINTRGAFVIYDGRIHSQMTSMCDLTRINIRTGKELPPMPSKRFRELIV